MKMKKKLDGGLKKISIYLLFFIFSSNISYSSQILDYETEEFIKEINLSLKILNDVISILWCCSENILILQTFSSETSSTFLKQLLIPN